MNREDLKNNTEFYIEHGYYHSDTPNSIKLFMEEELNSLHTLKLRLENQKYAYNNLLSIVDRCVTFKIIEEVFKEEITLPLPQEEYLAESIDYSFYLERMIDAIIKNKIEIIEASTYTRSINREEAFEEAQILEFDDDEMDVIEIRDNLGCSTILTDERMTDLIRDL